MARFIFIAGGVISGVGKGVATASIGRILQAKGFKVSAVKIDPYLNIDAGTMNPIEHGEVFVTEDGTECDLDIGHYERFLDENIYNENYLTSGQVYQTVIQKERNLEYKGKCVQIVPDIPNEVISRIKKVANSSQKTKGGFSKTKPDFILIEIGGTVGEYENILFLETARLLHLQEPKNLLFILVSYLPVPEIIGEMKTKPTQHAVRALNSVGIQPDIIIARSPFPVDEPRKKKIALFCNVKEEDVISAPDIESIYEVPLNFEKDDLGNKILRKFNLKPRKAKNLEDWKRLIKVIKGTKTGKASVRYGGGLKIGVVGKYFETGKFTLMDSYISVIEAIKHSSWFFKRRPEIFWLSAEKYEADIQNLKELKRFNGIIVPGGFGNRGVEGKIKAIEYCRKNKIPFLGLCLGMQLAVIEFARNVCGFKNANSAEFCPNCQELVIDTMSEQRDLLKEKKYGGTMRLGAYLCEIKPKTKAFLAYKSNFTSERHRHRYELNNEFRSDLEAKGMIMSGINPEKNLIEIIELKDHPFFVATQFHPEFKSRPLKPHPLFREFIRAAIKKD